MIWKIDLIVSIVELWALPVAIKRASLGNFYQKEKKKIVVDEENLIQPETLIPKFIVDKRPQSSNYPFFKTPPRKLLN